MNSLSMKNIAIIDAFPVHDCEKTVLSVGCGNGEIDYHLARIGYQVYATDIKPDETWQNKERLRFFQADIFDLTSFSGSKDCSTLIPIVICSQVLEHLRDYKKALVNLIELTKTRLILTFPYRRSFRSRSHVNFWDDVGSEEFGFKDVKEFFWLGKPYSVSISKILTKSRDAERGHRNYLMIIDKRQKDAYLG